MDDKPKPRFLPYQSALRLVEAGFVILLLIAVITLALYITGSTNRRLVDLFGTQLQFHLRFTAADSSDNEVGVVDIPAGTPVVFGGVRIGEVRWIAPAKRIGDPVVVRAAIARSFNYSDFSPHADLVPGVAGSSLFTKIVLLPPEHDAAARDSTFTLTVRENQTSLTKRIAAFANGVEDSNNKLVGILEEIKQALSVSTDVGDNPPKNPSTFEAAIIRLRTFSESLAESGKHLENITATTDKGMKDLTETQIPQFLKSADDALKGINDTLGPSPKPSANLKALLADLHNIMPLLQTDLKDLRSTIHNFGNAASTANERLDELQNSFAGHILFRRKPAHAKASTASNLTGEIHP
jgi:outer membrane murein-binding lipoprotein Lpp